MSKYTTNNIYKLFEGYFNGKESEIDTDEITGNPSNIKIDYRESISMTSECVVSKTLGDIHNLEKIPFYGLVNKFVDIVDSFHFISEYNIQFTFFSAAACVNKVQEHHFTAEEVFGNVFIDLSKFKDREFINNLVHNSIEDYLQYAGATDNVITIGFIVNFNPSEDCAFKQLLVDMKRLREFILTVNRYGRLSGFPPKKPACTFRDKEQGENFQFGNLIWKFLLNSDVERIGNFIFNSKKFSVEKNRDEEIHSLFPRAVYNFINQMIETFGSENIDITGIRAESLGNNTFESVFHLVNVKRDGYTQPSIVEAIRFILDNLSKTDKLALLDCYAIINIWMLCDDVPKERTKVPCEVSITDDFMPIYIRFVDDSPEARKFKYASKTNLQKDEYSIHGKTIKTLQNLYSIHKKDVERYIKR